MSNDPVNSHDARIERARRLRRDSTFPERLLWGQLRAGRLAGLKFRRQQTAGEFIVDFFCAQHQLAIELDGHSHNDRGEYDRRRNAWLHAQGLRVLRFGNDDVLNDLDGVLTAILLACGINPDK